MAGHGHDPDDAGREAPPSELVIFIAAEPGLAERLLAVHVPDERDRCRGCPNGAGPHLPWPCVLHRAAADAQAYQAERRRAQVASAPASHDQVQRNSSPLKKVRNSRTGAPAVVRLGQVPRRRMK